MKAFELVGHACPEGTYPSVVLPVGRTEDGRIVVLYQGAEGECQQEAISPEGVVRHNEQLSDDLKYFDPDQHRLFAYSPERVGFFQKGQEAEFFGEFLLDPDYRHTDPFVRLSLARLTRDERRVALEAIKCADALSETPEFKESWLEVELDSILSDIDPPPLHGQRRKILLIEDHIATSQSVRLHFDNRKYEVTCALDGLRGLALAVEIHPDIIILDLHLVLNGDYMDGYEILRRLKKYPTTSRIPVIIWSQYREEWMKRAHEFPDVHNVVGDIRALGASVRRAFLPTKEAAPLHTLVEHLLLNAG